MIHVHHMLHIFLTSRLEELLITYPPEDVEAKRWQKIATALGNRTPLQVKIKKKIFCDFGIDGLPIYIMSVVIKGEISC